MTVEILWDEVETPTEDDLEAARRERERQAMDALHARIAERDARTGQMVPTTGAVFPVDLVPPRPSASPHILTPGGADELARSGAIPTASPKAPYIHDAGVMSRDDAVMLADELYERGAAPTMPGGRDGADPSRPPPQPSTAGDPGPPAISTSPQTPPPTAEAALNPETPTVTAGAQAADMRRSGGPQQPPGHAMGGMGGAAMQRATQNGPEIREDRFARDRQSARDEDARRRRIRGILMGLAALGGMRTIGSGGSMGGALPGLIAAGMVRRPDEEETLLEGDTRAREVSEQEARQRALLDQIQMRRQGQMSEAEYRQQQLALRERELAGTQMDRQLRTGIALRENEREEELLLPRSDVSAREREALRATLRTQPREVQGAYPPEMLEGLSAVELRSIRDEIARGGRARTMAGAGRGGMAESARSAGRGPTEGIDTVPQNFLNMIRGRFENREDADYYAQLAWQSLPEDERHEYLRNPELDKWRTIRIPGYEQTDPGSQVGEQSAQQAQGMAVDRARLEAIRERANAAYEEIRDLDPLTQVRQWAARELPIEQHPAFLRFMAARSAGIGILNRIQTGSSMDENEFTRWEERISRPDSLLDILTGRAGAQLDAELAEAQADLDARIGALGYRRTDDARDSQPQAPRSRQGRVRVPYTLNGEERLSEPMPASRVGQFQEYIRDRGGATGEPREDSR